MPPQAQSRIAESPRRRGAHLAEPWELMNRFWRRDQYHDAKRLKFMPLLPNVNHDLKMSMNFTQPKLNLTRKPDNGRMDNIYKLQFYNSANIIIYEYFGKFNITACFCEVHALNRSIDRRFEICLPSCHFEVRTQLRATVSNDSRHGKAWNDTKNWTTRNLAKK